MAIPKVVLHAPGNYDPELWSQLTALHMVDEYTGEVLESLTEQSFKDECDINVIVERFGLTGELPENVKVPVSGDFTDVVDYQTALNAVIAADAAFMELPAKVREEFGHDPQKLMDFVANDKNREKAEELGLVAKRAEVTRDVVAAVDELREAMVKKD